ncbi:MAG: TVP38/TMEM64 family protein [Synechococcus sp. SB0673_bin_10]|uniref:TVP38/TMEM64 family membrane protein n=1 Tax=Synechococcus sp. SB0676_bin_10 TaxID=2604869 RepID=A0A6B1F9C2_9SYNE|nr:VTT domain-containing protein [Cyanobacteria bacterium MAG IRC3_bin_20]MCY3653523.1 VTT domain-containing protein [Cyanobacteria bacterium MAG IRC1_bin_28]MDE0648510.1 VTT domain-containing protein [Cyanobacteria bacterium MAG IRC4_bin_6]MXW11410.1 TVP38/TMEM64 family protein [Synechococcus sp. SB0668_bin_13]MXX08918.1 TVP38/TMEM64 family protein [Synechococcus sp. SB0667_bin_8]MXY18762.1 TVP38/TMEM64 family protein [Synechococcus sp. SB0664_bin_36]MYG37523.1 TVP38/TMEM64 family protein [S
MSSSLVESVETFLRELGPVGWIVFIALYALAVTFYVPGSVLTVLGGALLGPRLGVLAVLAGAFLGMVGNWFLTRRWLRPWAQRKLEQNPRLQRLEQVLSRDEGWKLVALLRLSPLFPFVLINLVCGLTSNLRFWPYMAASAAILPGTILYIYIGDTAGQGLKVLFQLLQWLWAGFINGGLEDGGLELSSLELSQLLLQVIGVVATFAVVGLVGRTASRVLKKQLSETDT